MQHGSQRGGASSSQLRTAASGAGSSAARGSAARLRSSSAADSGDGGEGESGTDVISFFFERVRKNFHMVLIFSPASPHFRARLRQFPSLVDCTTIDWFHEWPQEALQAVGQYVLMKASKATQRDHNARRGSMAGSLDRRSSKGSLDGASVVSLQSTVAPESSPFHQPSSLLVQLASDRAALQRAVEVCVRMHTRAEMSSHELLRERGRHNYITPANYLQLLKLYANILQKQSTRTDAKRRRYAHGVQRIRDAEIVVSKLNEELRVLTPQLEQARVDTEKVLRDVEEQRLAADAKRVSIEKEQQECAESMMKAQELKDECMAELEAAMPRLENSRKALRTLTNADISVIKSMKEPPKGVRLTMAAVCIMLRKKPETIHVRGSVGGRSEAVKDYWRPAKAQLLNDTRFLKTLLKFKHERLTDKILEKLQPFLESEEFTPAVVSKSSSAAAGLCSWVRATVEFHNVALQVAPKQERVEAASEAL